MAKHGLDLSTGEIWLDECASPIRRHMSLDEFLQTFSSIGAFRNPTQSNVERLGWPKPPPICHIKNTVCLLDTHLSISMQFSKDTTPTLSNIRMFVRPRPWSGIGPIRRLLRRLSGNPLTGMPKGFRSMKQELKAYEQWLHAATGRTEHHQTYPWGELRLINSRNECYLFQINYAE